MSRCSRVWGITPSSAATTEHGQVHPAGAGDHVAHEALVAGHVDHAQREVPSGRSSWAKPSSIEIPRACSSLSRSVSVPVSSATSAVLPWSTWPAVPRMSGATIADSAQGVRRARRRGSIRRAQLVAELLLDALVAAVDVVDAIETGSPPRRPGRPGSAPRRRADRSPSPAPRRAGRRRAPPRRCRRDGCRRRAGAAPPRG